MTQKEQQELGKTLWNIADDLRGAMNADDFRDYMLSFLFLRYLSANYEQAAAKELRGDYPQLAKGDNRTPLAVWYDENAEDVAFFEKTMRKKMHYVIQPNYLWNSIYELARTQSNDLLNELEDGFKHIENESFSGEFQGLFSEINLNSDKLGKTYEARNEQLCKIITKIAEGIAGFSTDSDALGDAYEYLIGQFAAGSGKKAGEFYTPQRLSDILSEIVTLDSQEPRLGRKKNLDRVIDFACGSGSLLLNVRKNIVNEGGTIGQIYGQEKNITTYNLARMNMLLHGVKTNEFEIFHGDTLKNDWNILSEPNPAKKIEFDAVMANPPFSLKWDASEAMAEDFRFRGYGLAPKSAADFAFLLHGFHYLSRQGTMAIILPHGVLFRGGAEERIRKKLVKDNNIDAIIGLPSNLFYSTGIPVCIIVLKKCKKQDDVLIINASEHYGKGKRQNFLRDIKNHGVDDVQKIVDTFRDRLEEDRYSRRVSLEEIAKNDYNLNITRYVSTSEAEKQIDLKEVNKKLNGPNGINSRIRAATNLHNSFLRELGLDEI